MKKLLTTLLLVFSISCAKDQVPTFALLPGEANFKQQSIIDNKIDVLWVIDNSGSMLNLQNNIANNFNAFIQDFVQQGYDFQIAVTTTEAWRARADAENDPSMAEFSDGVATQSGFKIITPQTPDLINTFITNISQGVAGHGDERPFESMQAALDSPLNAGFLRDRAYLAVIVVTDEDDFSHDGPEYSGEDYNYGLHTVESYRDYLDQLTNSTEDQPIYSVSGITIRDNDCLTSNTPWGNIGLRVQELVDMTEGIQGDVCSSDFSQTLNEIQSRIAELSTQFFIDRELFEETIEVIVDGQVIPESEVDGWTYHSEIRSIRFHGSAIPAQNSSVVVRYEPVTIK